MSRRLDQEREKRLTPTRTETALTELRSRGYEPRQLGDDALVFTHNGHQITYFPYSGWASGKGIKDGRGLRTLLKQLDEGKETKP